MLVSAAGELAEHLLRRSMGTTGRARESLRDRLANLQHSPIAGTPLSARDLRDIRDGDDRPTHELDDEQDHDGYHSGDFVDLMSEAFRLNGESALLARAHATYMVETAQVLIEQLWPSIESLASALIVHRSMTGPAAAEQLAFGGARAAASDR